MFLQNRYIFWANAFDSFIFTFSFPHLYPLVFPQWLWDTYWCFYLKWWFTNTSVCLQTGVGCCLPLLLASWYKLSPYVQLCVRGIEFRNWTHLQNLLILFSRKAKSGFPLEWTLKLYLEKGLWRWHFQSSQWITRAKIEQTDSLTVSIIVSLI